jgi:glycosyltransferase involved in cell wall biosynthesis
MMTGHTGMSEPLRILITNIQLASRSGTEIVVRDLAYALARYGHFPMIYCPRVGGLAQEIIAAGVPVYTRLEDIRLPPDIIHGHHHGEIVAALLHFPETAGIFVCHDRLAWHDIPPPHPRLLCFVAVDLNVKERLNAFAIPESRIQIVPNAVDTERFTRRAPLPKQPRKALIFSNYATAGTYVEIVQAACNSLGIQLDVVGSGVGRQSSCPEAEVGQYDLVFAKARCALEAMAAGCAVILCDIRGIGPYVTRADVEHYRTWNFGMRLLGEPHEAARVIEKIRQYDADDAARVRDYVRREASIDIAVQQYLSIYKAILAEDLPGKISNSDETREYLNTLLYRVTAVRDIPVQYSMLRMDNSDAVDGLQLRTVNPPQVVKQNAEFHLRVELNNEGKYELCSEPPYPVHLSYHWFTSSQTCPVIFDGLRTQLGLPLPPGSQRISLMKIQAPNAPGKYLLRVTLVQEHAFWFDDLSPPLFAEDRITVA